MIFNTAYVFDVLPPWLIASESVRPYMPVSVRPSGRQGAAQHRRWAWPSGVSTVRLPRASWSISMASKRDLKFPAPKPWRENRHTQMANYPEICLLLCRSPRLWGFSSPDAVRGAHHFEVRITDEHSHGAQTLTGSRARRQPAK